MKRIFIAITLATASVASPITSPAYAQVAAPSAIDYINANYKLVYPTAIRPITFTPFGRADAIMVQAIQKLLDRGARIGHKGVAPIGKEPAALYDDAVFVLTRASNEKRGDEFFPFNQGNLSTFAGRIYLALLRDAPAAGGPVLNCNAQVNAALDRVDAAVKASRP